MDQMRNKGYAHCAVRFNLMMTLYMKLNEYDKIDQLISEMKQKNVRLDTYSYNSWLSAQRSKGSAEGMEHVLEQIKLDSTISPGWVMFSTMTSCYMKLGQIEKAEECLRNLETGIRGRDNKPYRSLMSLYSTLGTKQEVYRVWSLCKSKFPRVPCGAYHAVISARIRWGDFRGAEKFYQEWLQTKSTYEPRMGNLLMACYVREEHFEKAKHVFDQLIEAGGRPNCSSWEILGWGHTKEGRIHDALSCFREAVFLAKGKNAWKPQPCNVSAFLELCVREGDVGSKVEFVRLLGELSCFQDSTFKSILGDHTSIEVGDHDDHVVFSSKTDTDDETEETQSEGSEMLMAVME